MAIRSLTILKRWIFFDRAIIGETQNSTGIAFGLSLGDLVGDNLDLHIPYAKTVKKVGIPWYQVMGNHDMNYEATADSLSDETFEKNSGPCQQHIGCHLCMNIDKTMIAGHDNRGIFFDTCFLNSAFLTDTNIFDPRYSSSSNAFCLTYTAGKLIDWLIPNLVSV